MNLWLVLPVLVLIALVYVLLPVGVAAATRYRLPSPTRCPVTGQAAQVTFAHAGFAEVLGVRALRKVTSCSLWPARRHCAQRCRLHDGERAA